ncbi:M14 family metallopeptidase [Halalkalibacterium ligniniphilum]|uniref:M14 family metallopeptidase n=1 Tax=Halalkalibacterium ligniniphilum TaxID=1134413 RepID=UPI000344D9B3|nr:M14 family metallopeptidase [Halalkalibacterium ligniniphilum]
MDLREIWTTNGWLLDENGDGVPDAINLVIQTENTYPLGLIDIGARLGLETTGANFELFQGDGEHESVGWSLTVKKSEREGLVRCSYVSEKSIQIEGKDDRELNVLLRFLAAKWPHELAFSNDAVITEIQLDKKERKVYLFGIEGEKVDTLPWPDQVDEGELDPLEPSAFKGICDLWTMSGLYQNNRVDLTGKTDVLFVVQEKISKDVVFECVKLAARIGLYSTGIRFPLTFDEQRIPRCPELVIEVKKTVQQKGSVTWYSQKYFERSYPVLCVTGTERVLTNALHYLTKATPVNEGGDFGVWEKWAANKASYKEGEPLLLEKQWEDRGEKVRLMNFVRQEINKHKTSREAAEIIVYISEPSEIRKEIALEINKMLQEARIPVEHVIVRSAFKTGYLWIEEEVLPELKAQKDFETITIRISKESNSDGLELKTRWLQELYPIDRLLAQQLPVHEDQVIFELEDNLEDTYVIEIKNKTGTILNTFRLSVPTTRIPYIDGRSFVYPTTGHFEWKAAGKILFSTHNPTDRERFWMFVLQDVLPALGEATTKDIKEGQGITKPLFQSIRFDVEMSEEERKIGIDEERISSLEALHEDLYFNSLDYFEHLGKEQIGKGWSAPGGIHPFVRAGAGVTPRARVTAYGWSPGDQVEIITHALYFDEFVGPPVEAYIELKNNQNSRFLSLEAEQWSKKQRFEWEEEDIKELLGLPGVRILRGGVSYQGRDIPVVEVFKPSSSQFISPHALSVWKPTVLIEAGHHANEVSSMPAVRRLVKKILEDYPNWLDAFNLIVIPCANLDGRALHRELVIDNPEWKHHAARYNYVGLEYTHVRYTNTEFGEADVMPMLIHRWLPDIVIDDHGIPAHEWVQPFAGYNSPPRFPVSYWMPNALIYGIARELERETYPKHAQVLDAITESIAEQLNSDKEIRARNDEWKKRYKKYGHHWLPETFPLEETDGMIFYRWKARVSRASTSYIERYPQWCSADIISEAADETVYGKPLELCIQAHCSFNLGVLDLLNKNRQFVNRETDNQFLSYHRKRPLTIS